MSFRGSHKVQLQERKYNNWVKGGLALKYLKGGIGDFADEVFNDEQRRILQTLGLTPGSTCNLCTLKTLKPPHAPASKVKSCPIGQRSCNCLLSNTSNCPNNICDRIYDEIVKSHGTLQPFWKNTDITKWTTQPWEIAKCFINVPGYDRKTSAADTDVAGLLHLFINCTFFQGRVSSSINLFDKIRELRNSVFHSPSMELEDQQLTDGINDIITLLEDDRELKAKECSKQAVLNLKSLEQENFIITTETEAEVCRAALASITLATEELKHIRDESNKEIEFKKEEVKKYMDLKQEEALKNFQGTAESCSSRVQLELSELRMRVDNHDLQINVLQTRVRDIEIDVEKLKQAQDHQTEHLREVEHELNLKEDIITYYREHESVIPASPLVEEHNVPIEDLYVLPLMWAYKDSYFGQDKNRPKGDKTSWNDGQDKQEITISELFLSGDERYRKIYITANAGFGKTSLSQKLTMTWCQSQSPLKILTEYYDDKELAAMKYFDFLFLLHLRDYQSEPTCNLDDLIMNMLSACMSRKSQYKKEFIERILHEKKCLVILDGLDEWAHPGHCTRKPEIPHNNHPNSCTVFTTTRDWKIGTVGLSPKDIDRRVEISILDDATREQLEENAICILNEKGLNLVGKIITDFDDKFELLEIGDIIYNPYILLQLMCLFFGGLPIGKSKCEIYSNITEFTLERGLNKKDLPDIQVQTKDNAQVPNCMNENETCKRYYILLMKLGKLAFYTLFSEKRESSLIFDRRILTQYMTEQEIEFCLKVGLLCQTKDSSIIAVKRYHVFFQHKSVQEFFSAIYIMSEWQNESVKSTILNVCSSLSGILEMSNVFVFVCGMNPEVYTCISGELQTIVDLDSSVRQCRTDVYIDSDVDAWISMKCYQSMQLDCLQESLRNGNDSCPIPLYFGLDKHGLTYDVKALKSIMQVNESIVESPQVSLNEKTVASMLSDDPPFVFMQSLDPGVFTSLETLRVEDCDEEPVWLADILTESARTLKCPTLSLNGCSLSDISITALTGLTCLQSFYLDYVNMTHSNLKCFYAYISQTTTLTQLKLEGIECSDHEGQYSDCDVALDLHRLNELKMLHLDVPCRDLHVNPAFLEELDFLPQGEKMTARASATLWQDLRAAPVLSSLTLVRMTSCQEMITTIPTLTQLQHLVLGEIDMGDVIPRVSPAMTQLERVELEKVTMSSTAWGKLFLSIGQLPRSITVTLSRITMTSQEWRELLLSVGQVPRSITVELTLITMTSQEWRELLLSVGGLQHPVTVELSYCRGPSEEEWMTIVNVIKTTPTLLLLQDLSIPLESSGYASMTLKNQ